MNRRNSDSARALLVLLFALVFIGLLVALYLAPLSAVTGVP